MEQTAGGYQNSPFTAEFYDYVVPYRERQDVGFFVDLAREANRAASETGGAVLEIGCGTGRVLIPTARAGVTITGLDVAESMLQVCRTRLAAEVPEVQARVSLHRRDMRDFDLGQRFGLITVPFRSFQHVITVDDQLAALACIHRHLADGGRLALDLFNPSLPYLVDETRLGEFGEEPEFTMPDGRRVSRRTRIRARDLLTQMQDVEMVYYVTHPDGRQERLVHDFSMRYLFRYEAEHLLVRAGFKLDAVYSDYDRSPYGAKYPGELIFVASKA